jgi:hypothetical protein
VFELVTSGTSEVPTKEVAMNVRHGFATIGILLLLGFAGPACASDDADAPADQPSATVSASPTPSASTSPGASPSPSPSGEDISGNCDEAEHADDPGCEGAGDGDDNSGPGSGDDSGSGSDSG